MRVIKFRAWDEENKVMYPVDRVAFDAPHGTWINNHGYHLLLQFTGLKDRNGKEIYESDILKHFAYNHQGLMEWNNERGEWTKFLPLEQFEVIGNTFEHPHLLTQNIAQ